MLANNYYSWVLLFSCFFGTMATKCCCSFCATFYRQESKLKTKLENYSTLHHFVQLQARLIKRHIFWQHKCMACNFPFRIYRMERKLFNIGRFMFSSIFLTKI